MKKSTWNPTRRNRNIGTEKSGYSQNNKLVVPERWSDCKIFWERLVDPVIFSVEIKKHKITIMVEPTKKGYVYATTPQDIVKVLELIEEEHLEEIDLIVLRQPKEKEEILMPAWGRFVYYADLGRYSGPAVYLEAIKIGAQIKWDKSLSPFYKKELRALESDGHKIETVKRGYIVHTTPASVRNTQLFRTLPHEFGHAVDYLHNSLNPAVDANSEAESDYISAGFNSKPQQDKEEYANRYAREFYAKWTESGDLPFERVYDKETLEKLGLNPDWFNY